MSTVTDYFEHPFAETMVNSTVMSEEESNSSSSISPTEKIGLAYPSQDYFVSAGTTYLINDYDCCTAHPYAAAFNTQNMMYTVSSPEEPQAYFHSSHEGFVTTSSPTSTITSASFNQFSPGIPFNTASKNSNSEEMDFYQGSSTSNYDYSRSMFNYHPSSSSNESPVSIDALAMVVHGDRHRDNKSNLADSGRYPKHIGSSRRHYHETQEKKNNHAKRHSQSKAKKRCGNCHTPNSPSWRRSISKPTKGDLLCNACGLYEKTAKRKRMLVTQDDGVTKVVRKRDVSGYTCCRCGTTDATRWHKKPDAIQCEKCARGRR